MGCSGDELTIEWGMSGSKAQHSTLKASATSRLDVDKNGDTARKNACVTRQDDQEVSSGTAW